MDIKEKGLQPQWRNPFSLMERAAGFEPVGRDIDAFSALFFGFHATFPALLMRL
jgi:hypothetical protein